MRPKDILEEILKELDDYQFDLDKKEESAKQFLLYCINKGFEAGLETEVLEDCPNNLEAKFCDSYSLCKQCKNRKL